MGSAQPTLGPKGRELLLLVHYTGEEHSAVQITDFTPSPGDTCTSGVSLPSPGYRLLQLWTRQEAGQRPARLAQPRIKMHPSLGRLDS